MKKIIYILIFVLCFFTVYAQNSSVQKYQLAEAYEKTGDFENASRLYYEIYKITPKNKKYLDAVIRSYKVLHQYSALLSIIEEHLKIQQSADLIILSGELYWRTGKTNEANHSWQEALSMPPKNPEIYIDVAESQSSVMLFDKAISTLEDGKKIYEGSFIFSEKLIPLYIAVADYVKGVDEILDVFESDKNLAMAQGRLSALMTGKSANEYIDKELDKKASGNDNNQFYLRLYGWFLKSVNPEKALDIFNKLDNLTGGIGTEIARFANDSKQDGNFDIALKAYDMVIAKGKNNPHFLTSLFGFARTLEYKIQENPNIAKETIEKIISRYKQIVKEYSYDLTAADSRLRIAQLSLDYMNDKETAKEELKSIIKQFPQQPVTATALNLLGSIDMMDNKMDDASESYSQVINKYKRYSPFEVDKASFLLAQIQYYKGNIDSAFTLYTNVSANTSSDIANDALNKIILIDQNKQFTQALKLFAEAEFRELQKDTNQALIFYKQIIETASGSDLAEQSLVRQAKIEFQKANYLQVRKLLSEFLEKNPDTIYGDISHLLIGDSYLNENNTKDAENYYTRLIVKYPRSIYAQEAREKIRKIRSKNS
ncbi:MAG: tetratricopeptide repeat protein [Ignavibacteriae bacterium]|nr:tetratricopeptide repeat protein [Ignavibacteriota bacterium]